MIIVILVALVLLTQLATNRHIQQARVITALNRALQPVVPRALVKQTNVHTHVRGRVIYIRIHDQEGDIFPMRTLLNVLAHEAAHMRHRGHTRLFDQERERIAALMRIQPHDDDRYPALLEDWP